MTVSIVKSMSTHELIELGFGLDADGFVGRELAVRRMVRHARDAGLAGAAIDVLADTTAPDVARFRAFASVAAALRRPTPFEPATRTVA
jgi:hypothetical protein